MSNPNENLYINDVKFKSNVTRINSGFILFKSEKDFNLKFIVFQLPINCRSREFVINPREGNSYEINDVKAKLDENATYCLVIAGENEFDLTIANSASNNNEISYSQFDLSNGASIAAGESRTISSTLGVCIRYTDTTSVDSSLTITINKDNHNSETPSTIFGHDINGLEYKAKDSINVMDFTRSLNLGLNKLIIKNTTTNIYVVARSSYVVFTEFKGISCKVSTLGGTANDILGSTKIVAVYFNTSGYLTFQTDEKTPQPCRLVYFKTFPSNCNQIFTISGEGSIEDEAEGNETLCVAAAFSSGTAKIEVEGKYNYYQADGVTTPQSLDDSVDLKFTSAVAVNFSSNTDDDAEFKLSVKTDDNDKSTKYVIKPGNEYKSYYYAGKEFGELNGKHDSKKEKDNKAIMIVIISVVTVIIIAAIVAIYICYVKKRKMNQEAGIDTVPLDNYGELQDNFADPLVDDAN
ncbi:hypothetical protein TVAG_081930 [Trichomonas vaginalis G3]|uniref:Uncharacterized protein n=1 Tax=Trichomonas vaginalis (strain ATCC PRA-98 / G3) TaxID=412133 RepID=A2E6Y5_TRIV3|nr:hypothetical protein TVAGG3_0492790 [Trichomonas vaginalis G3]EAY11621.1 hypothetical protein TVAG_081930 [Trichomonas vaginalis G3]KAI5516498.1 hypothetical protein TVAGG3_0492790 [Trichomonas vaginalis G3]|eukprot:XP_001323844.1 hypothetical protein [Trichomonas vaginalis G3]